MKEMCLEGNVKKIYKQNSKLVTLDINIISVNLGLKLKGLVIKMIICFFYTESTSYISALDIH